MTAARAPTAAGPEPTLLEPLTGEAGGPSRRILLVSQPAEAPEPWVRFLEAHGFEIVPVSDPADALASRPEAALIVVQLADPGHEGLAVCQSLAEGSEAPILALGESCDLLDRVAAIEFGADDYLGRGSHPLEILAKVRALVRRAERYHRAQVEGVGVSYRFAGLWFHPATRRLLGPRGEVVKINRSEGALLTAFLEHPGEALSRARVMEMMHVEAGLASRTVDVRVGRLRRKLRRSGEGVEVIRTIYGAGYALCTTPVVAAEPLAAEARPPH